MALGTELDKALIDNDCDWYFKVGEVDGSTVESCSDTWKGFDKSEGIE